MKIESLKLVYFSPTGTTKSVVRHIARGIEAEAVETIDITTPDARQTPLTASATDLLVVGVPVYMGRVPELLDAYLNAIRACDTPTVCVVVYGNRAYDDALLELKNIVMARGCRPVAAAAYIGEHSFSAAEAPIGPGRPDADDLRQAEAFGRLVAEKLRALPSISRAADLAVPGTVPYRERTGLQAIDFIAVSDHCGQCGACAEACPTGAIDPQDGARIDVGKCILCCACLRACPEAARTVKPGRVMDSRIRLSETCREPRKPECFL